MRPSQDEDSDTRKYSGAGQGGGDRIVRPREAAHLLGVSRQTLWRLTRAGRLPRPRRVSANCTGWLQSELDAYLASLADVEVENGSPSK